MPAETVQERYSRLQATETVPVRLVAARDHARALVVATFTDTWTSSGGCQYRKNGVARQLGYVKARTAVEFIADYMLPHTMPDTLWSLLVEEAVAAGELIRDEHTHRPLHPPHEADRAAVEALPVRSIP